MSDELTGYKYTTAEGVKILVTGPTAWAPKTYVNVTVTHPDGTVEHTVRPVGVVRATRAAVSSLSYHKPCD